jgi:hypothetical protein
MRGTPAYLLVYAFSSGLYIQVMDVSMWQLTLSGRALTVQGMSTPKSAGSSNVVVWFDTCERSHTERRQHL